MWPAGPLDLARSSGADHVIDHTTQTLDAAGVDYDLVLDIGGNTPIHRLRAVTARRGRVVIVGGEGGDAVFGIGRQLRGVLLSPFVPQSIRMFVAKERRADLVDLDGLVERGALTPVVGRTYPLADAAVALRDLEGGRARGALALAV